ncbi:hypothetical protein [Brevundimonas pondensis]|jgi:hypothetical protein|uniref:Uncharacterized protein n=1 Tax=Brevundimonas pondensis TaxID=2774189 RepID=A0ABX7SM59_9CAUL|nr:hypothetical protein [Brevundimonas pondensis]QTC88118.1 hypothetical protein IFE19_01535 [Brevundimonas pondensis]
MTDRQTVAGAYAKIDSHERECTLRYEALNNSIRDLKDGMKWVIRLAIGIMLSLIGWLAVQLWDANNARIDQAASHAEGER